MKHLKRKRMTLGYVLACATASMMVAYGPALAHETPPPYAMAVIVDAAHGYKVHGGKYEAAIAKLTSPKAKSYRDEFARQTNLCVAYTKTGDLESAEVACESALARINQPDRKRPYYSLDPDAGKYAFRQYVALAYSNLGVVKAMRGDMDAAHADFEKALSLSSSSRATKNNLARLEVRRQAAG